MKKAAKIVGISLLMLCFSITASFYFFFDAAQLQCKVEAGGHVKTGRELQVIKLSTAEFQNNRTDDEIWVNGQLYDINSYTVHDGIVWVSVFHDRDEEYLVKGIIANFDQSGQLLAGNSAHVARLHPVHDDTKILAAPVLISVSFIAKKSEPHSVCSLISVQYLSSIPTPPPDRLFS